MAKKTKLMIFTVIMVLIAVLLQGARPPAPQSYGEADIGGTFTLTGTGGQRVKSGDLDGRFTLVYLGYTHCPDICPATLSMLGESLKKIGTDADRVNVVFITLDPAHDSPHVLGEYLKSFDARIIGLTGSEAEIKAVTHAFKAYASSTENAAPGNMLIAHSGLLYLMDRQGKYLRHFESGVNAEVLVAALRDQL